MGHGELDGIVVDGFALEVVRDPANLKRPWDVFAPMVEDGSAGGRLIRVGYQGRVVAYAVADARSGHWFDIGVADGPDAATSIGAFTGRGDAASAFWERVVGAVAVACGLLFDAGPDAPSAAGPAPR